MFKYSNIFISLVKFDFNFINAFYSFINFRLIVSGDLILLEPYGDYSSKYFGLCLAKFTRKFIISSTLKLRNVFHLNIVEKIYGIGCSFHFFDILRIFSKMFFKGRKSKLFYFQRKLRSSSVFTASPKEFSNLIEE